MLWPASTSTLTSECYRFSREATRSLDYVVTAPAFLVPRAGVASTSNGTHAFFAGGVISYSSISGYRYTDTLDVYIAGSRSFQKTLSQSRGYMTATTILTASLSISLFAGGNDNSGFYQDVDVYNHKTDTLTSTFFTQRRKDAAAGSGLCARRFAVLSLTACVQLSTTLFLLVARRSAVVKVRDSVRATSSISMMAIR
jgi:hypothetical protein